MSKVAARWSELLMDSKSIIHVATHPVLSLMFSNHVIQIHMIWNRRSKVLAAISTYKMFGAGSAEKSILQGAFPRLSIQGPLALASHMCMAEHMDKYSFYKGTVANASTCSIK